jgi:hypothetical protein
MIDSIKITSLNDIGSNIAANTVFPVVNTAVPITNKANLQIIGNLILSGAGSPSFVQAAQANLAQEVVNSAQPNITSVGTLLSLEVSGNISGNTNGFAIGYLNIPQVAASNTTIGLSDAGKHYYSTSSGNFTLTIPNDATTEFEIGTTISIVVQSAGNILVNAGTGVTLYMAGNSTAADRVVGGYGMATLLKVATDTWFINGTGVT